MNEEVKLKILENILKEVSRRYDELVKLQEKRMKQSFEMAVRDPLTGLYNRYFLKDVFYREVERAKRDNTCIALIFLDIDRFKTVNDRHGHETGDKVLRNVAELLRNSFRPYDTVVRYGGDEFVILSECKGFDFEKRLKELVIDLERRFKRYKISISYGFAFTPKESKTLEGTIAIADKRMYQMKKSKYHK